MPKKPSSMKKSKQYAKPKKTDKQRAKLLGTGAANKAAKAIMARKKQLSTMVDGKKVTATGSKARKKLVSDKIDAMRGKKKK